MTEKKIFKIFLIYFSLYFLIGISCAWIPFAYLSVAFILLAVESAALLRLTSRRPHVLRVHSGCSHQPRLAANPIASSIDQ